jgi:cytochrome P450
MAVPGTTAVRDEELGRDYARFCDGDLGEPYRFTATLRELDPVHWSERLNSWILTRYVDVLEGLSDPRFGNDRIAAYMAALSSKNQRRYAALGEHLAGWLGFTDPPQHTRLRSLVREFFTPQLAVRLRPLIQDTIDDALKGYEGETVDLVSAVAFPLPAAVISEVLGIPIERRDELKSRADAIIPFAGNIGPSLNEVAEAAQQSLDALQPFFADLLARRLREPREDLITRLAILIRDGELTEPEVVSLCVFVFVAGFETTTSLIASALLLLLQNDSERNRLRADRALGTTAVEEFLRIESPIQMVPRLIRQDVRIGEREIAAGDTVLLMIGAANHDPAQFPDPDRLDVGRTPNRHLAFGWAAHFCLGAPLARLEAESAVTTFLERYADAELDIHNVEWARSMAVRSPTRLPVRIGPGAPPLR